MANNPAADLADLRHDIVTKCTNLKDAVAQLCGEATEDELETIQLMRNQAWEVAERMDAYAASRGLGRKR